MWLVVFMTAVIVPVIIVTLAAAWWNHRVDKEEARNAAAIEER